MSDYYIPDDLLIDILCKIPLSDLLNFRLVCKSWASLISSHEFGIVSFNSNKELNRIHHLLVRYCSTAPEVQQFFCLYIDGSDIIRDADLHIPIPHNVLCNIIGYCNGLVALVHLEGMTDVISIWNPTIGRSIMLPESNFTFSSEYQRVFGFGYDDATNDHKLVCLIQTPRNPTVEIYSLRRGDWSVKVCDVASNMICENSSGYAKGYIQWLCGGGRFPLGIMAFNTHTETISITNLPDSLNNNWVPGKLSIAEFQGSIFILENQANLEGKVLMWAKNKKENTWTVLCEFAFENARFAKLVGVGRLNRLVVTINEHLIALGAEDWVINEEDEEKVISVNPRGLNMSPFELIGSDDAFWAHSFKKSLFLMDKKNGGSGEQAWHSVRQA